MEIEGREQAELGRLAAEIVALARGKEPWVAQKVVLYGLMVAYRIGRDGLVPQSYKRRKHEQGK